jgi:uncharacterized protein (TIGR01777 family)
MRVAVTGASGLLGSALVRELGGEGDEVLRVVRREPVQGIEIRWDPARGDTDPGAWNGVDAIVNLAGEGIASGRWTRERKRRILESRVRCTDLAVATARAITPRPRVLVNASAIGFYGDRGNARVGEDDGPGDGFLAEVCTKWEESAVRAADAGIRVVPVRIGIVLSRAGGALARMLAPFRLGFGGRLGNGRQFMSWIAMEDMVSVLMEAIRNDSLAGPVNAVSPGAVTNAEFTRILGKVLRRPTPFPVPAPALRLLLGEMADGLLLEGARVRPDRLQTAGFRFAHPELESALQAEVG